MTQDAARVAILRHLSTRHPGFLVWKHLDRALLGMGDVDAAVPAVDVRAIAAEAKAVAKDLLAATTVITCEHVADKHLLFFVQPQRLPQLFELDLCSQPSRGLAPWADPRRMAALTIMSPEGIRRLRPGAEAVVSLVYHGLSLRGGDRLLGSERDLVQKGLIEDEEGVLLSCHRLVPLPARGPVLELLRRLQHGSWDPSSAAQAQAGFVLSGLAHPRHTIRRAGFRVGLATGRECVMSRLARRDGRRVGASDLDNLLFRARAGGHTVEAC